MLSTKRYSDQDCVPFRIKIKNAFLNPIKFLNLSFFFNWGSKWKQYCYLNFRIIEIKKLPMVYSPLILTDQIIFEMPPIHLIFPIIAGAAICEIGVSYHTIVCSSNNFTVYCTARFCSSHYFPTAAKVLEISHIHRKGLTSV